MLFMVTTISLKGLEVSSRRKMNSDIMYSLGISCFYPMD